MSLRRAILTTIAVLATMLVLGAFIAFVIRSRCPMPGMIDRTTYNSPDKLRGLLGSPTNIERVRLDDSAALAKYGVQVSAIRTDGLKRVDIYVWRSACPQFVERTRVVAIIDPETGNVLSLKTEDSWM